MTSPLDASMFDVGTGQKCCEACQCECQTGGCKSVDTGQQSAFRYDRVFEALEQIMENSSGASYESTMRVDPESLAPEPSAQGPAVVAPSLNVLGCSPAHRTAEEMCADRQDLFVENVNANPFAYFLSCADDGNEGFDDADMFGIPDMSDSTRATPGLSDSEISLLSGWSQLFQLGANNSNPHLVGIGAVTETSPFLHLSSHDRP